MAAFGLRFWCASICGGAAALGAAPGAPLPAAPPAARIATAPAPDPGSAVAAARLSRQIAGLEYRASENGSGLQAPNRHHALRTYFGPTGIRVHDRIASGEPRLFELELARIGRGTRLAAVSPGRVASEGARVEIRRPDLVEWYRNAPEGLEQGFTLARRPRGGDAALVLELALSGAQATLSGAELRIAAAGGRRFDYGALAAWDAAGAALPARLETSAPGRIALVVDDRGATYPLTIDPLLTATADTLIESDQLDAQLGSGVAGAGDVNGDGYADVIVGAETYDNGHLNEGAAFVFLGGPEGIADSNPSSANVGQLESNQAGALMGVSVAGAGDVNGDGYSDVIVGAQEYDAGQSNEGAAFVFLGSPSGVADSNPTSPNVAQLEADQADTLFGGSVAGAGDVNGDGYADVIVGAEMYNSPFFDEGAAFLFLGSASGIADANPTTAAAELESDQTGALLGVSVAGAGDVNGDGYSDVIVGAELYDSPTTDEGAAFVFLGGPSGIASGNPLTAATQVESNQGSALFGGNVAGAGDVDGDGYADVIVGAEEYNNPSLNEGAAFVFLGSSTGIADADVSTAAAQIEADQDSALLGGSVAGAGDVNGDGYADVIIGAPQYDDPTFNEGVAFVFLGSSTGIPDGTPASAAAKLQADQSAAQLGAIVAGAGDVNGDGYADVIVGADAYDNPTSAEGAAFVFLGGAAGIADGTPATAATQLESDQADALLGAMVAGAGDVNGDGYADLIVGAEGYDAGESDEGAAFVFLGGASGLADASADDAAAQLESDQADARFGASVAGAGDLNADGFADVVVGAREYDSGESDEGAAFVFLGGASGVADGSPATAAARLESDQAGALFGTSVAAAGDANGDGYGDLLVGAETYDAGESDEGAAFVFLGGASGVAGGTPASAAARLESDQAGALFGGSVASAGDVDGDGYADLLVGAREYDSGESDEGAAFVFLGPPGDRSAALADTRLQSDEAGALFGGSVAGAGDVDGDGYADVIVGAESYDGGEVDGGAAFVFLGGASGVADATPVSAAARLESDQAEALLGSSVAAAGDVDGDGYPEVIVGAPAYDAGHSDEGAAFVFAGGPSGVVDATPAGAASMLEAEQAGALLGGSVAGVGDLNGDGFGDVVVGAESFDAGEGDEGAALVFLGNGDRDGRTVRAEQRRGDASAVPVQPWGRSHAGGFEVALTATHPDGRGRVKLEVEACPNATPFGDPLCTTQVSATWTDATASADGVRLVEVLSGLDENTRHRWRARVLRAPYHVTQAGITPPANPTHGPWRRVQAQAVAADILVPEPSELVLLLAALAFLGVAGRRRIVGGS